MCDGRSSLSTTVSRAHGARYWGGYLWSSVASPLLFPNSFWGLGRRSANRETQVDSCAALVVGFGTRCI